MPYKLSFKCVVIFIKIVASLLLSRFFGNMGLHTVYASVCKEMYARLSFAYFLFEKNFSALTHVQ